MKIWIIILAYVGILNADNIKGSPELYGDLYGSQIEQRTKELFQSKAECEKGLLSLLKAKDKLIDIDGSKVVVHQKANAEQIKVMQITLHSKCMQVEIP